ncbi:DUF4383 domain-containing protein [Nocardioides humilatus]|uniref:DUF4383 domain-containing protein n=1 Tax=Nocardioides humilatus TaxID=2607660 RepID=A0A5B1LE65_9ACTN|nr:DUF4383 domain-containing protein [Nocardioides humilatus]KAA1419021.1 DUF4383 domain-containing protein [Nocardioides humilatus]
MASITGWRRWLFFLCLVMSAWSIAGLIANPDFSVGQEATSVQVLGVDFNAWHALAGLAIFLPGLVAAHRDAYAVPYTWAAIVSMSGGLLGLFTDRPLGLFYFANVASDIALHLGTVAAFAALLLLRRWELGRSLGSMSVTRDADG